MIESVRWNGERVSKAGVYSGIPLDDYHSGDICDGPSVSSSGLRKLWNKSPAHFWDTASINPNRNADDDESDAFVLGRAAHHLFLGEDNFSTIFIQRPAKVTGLAWQGNRSECKAWLKQQRDEGRTVLVESQVVAIQGMARSLAAEPLVQDGILAGGIELSAFARDPETSIWLKARPDAMPESDGMAADLKTTPSVLDIDLKRTLRNFAYNMQGGLVWEVCELLGIPFTGFVLVFVEKKPPYCVRIVEMTDDDISRGRQQNRAMIRLMSKCLETGVWPGPGRHDAEFFSLPQTEQEFIDKRLAAMEA